MNQPQPYQTPNKDRDHLNILAICHYVYAGLMLLSLFLVFGHYLIMTFTINMETQENGETFPDEFMGYLRAFYVFSGLIIIAIAVANFFAARALKQDKNKLFLLIISGLNCFNMPLGTTLGVFTIIVLMRPTVIDLYARNEG